MILIAIRQFFVLAAIALLPMFPSQVLAGIPDCTHPDAWPAGMAYTRLKNAGTIDNDVLDFTKTRVTRLASEKIGKSLYRQVHLVRFFKKSGERIDAITVNEVSHQECSMSDVDVYVVSKRLGNYSSE